MEQTWLRDDVAVFTGRHLHSTATAFLHGDDVLLVDSMGAIDDARALKRLFDGRGERVRYVVCTHFMDDHTAGLRVFDDAVAIAHPGHRATFLTQPDRDDAAFVAPQLLVDGSLRFRWGAHELHIAPNPGKTPDHLYVDVPTADLVCAGDNIVGNIVYLSRADPEQSDAAIARMQRLGRGSVVSGHMGLFPARTLSNAREYLRNLRAAVIRAWHLGEAHAERQIREIRIEDCLAADVVPRDFEREWHAQNLAVIRLQRIFALDAGRAPAA